MSPEAKLAKIKDVMRTAERWCDEQLMAEGQICMAALKDIRRIINEEE